MIKKYLTTVILVPIYFSDFYKKNFFRSSRKATFALGHNLALGHAFGHALGHQLTLGRPALAPASAVSRVNDCHFSTTK
jgi:hypothetical protein